MKRNKSKLKGIGLQFFAAKKYYQLAVSGNEADITIYGDITSWEWLESDVSSYTLSREIADLDVDTINVYINSYGGEVAEGLAIYNALKRHKAKIKTFCDGFACSAASVVYMAGDERIMSNVSLLMIHNAWSYAAGNSNELRKQADDLETITQASVNAYMACVSISEEKVKEMMDAETWITPADALEMGFATTVTGEPKSNSASQSARKTVYQMLTKPKQAEPTPAPQPEPTEDPEPTPEPKPTQEPEPASEPTPEPEQNLTTFLSALTGRKD